MTGRLSKLLTFAAFGIALVALIVTLSTMRSSRSAHQDLEALRSDLARQEAETSAAQSKAVTALSQRVTDASAQAASAANAAGGVADLATRVSKLESDSESYARAIEFLDSKYPQAKLDEEVVGRIAESGQFTILQSGVPVGSETYDLYRTEDGYALVAKAERTDGLWGSSLSQVLRMDEALRPTSVRLEGMVGATARNERAEFADGDVRLTTATGRVVTERLAPEDKVAVLDVHFASPLIMIHRAIGMPEDNATVEVGASVQGRAVLTLEGSIADLTLRPSVPVSIISPEVRELGYRHDVRVGDEVVIRYYVLNRTVVGVEVPGRGEFAYRSDLFPHGFRVESRVLLDMALPEEIREQEVTFTNEGQKLVGTLTAPKSIDGKIPVLFIVPDLGPADRDGSSLGLQTRIGRDLARSLALRGVASYRYDRRGLGASEGQYEATGLASLLADARVALALLRAIPFVDPLQVYAVGVGRGGVIAAELAASGSVSGVITLSTPSAPLGSAWLEELRASSSESLPTADVDLFVERETAFQDFVRATAGTWQDLTFAQVRAALPWMTELELARRQAVMPLPLLRDVLDLDPLASFGRVAKRTVVIQGDKSPLLPSSEGFALTEAVNANSSDTATLSIIPDMNGAMRPHPEAADSRDLHLEKDVDVRVIELIADWCGISIDHGAPGGPMPAAM